MSFFGGRRQQEEAPQPNQSSKKPEPPPAPRQPVGFETVLGINTSWNGDFRGQGNARIDGVLEGTLEIDGNILIGETAQIKADIHARNISIAGAVRGNVHGNKVQILRTGRVWGDIHAAAITTEEGAFIDGKIAMVSHEAAVQSLSATVSLAQETDDIDTMDDDMPIDVEAIEEDAAIAAAVALEDAEDLDETFDNHESDIVIELPVDETTLEAAKREDLPIDEDGAVG